MAKKFTLSVLLALGMWGCSGSSSPTDGGGVDAGRDAASARDASDDAAEPEDAGRDDDAGDMPDAGMPMDDGGTDRCADVDCSDLDDMCVVGVCDPVDGSCDTMPRADGTACDDGDACTTGDVCGSGACTGAAVDCSGSDDMCNVGICSEGSCTTTPRMDGTGCDDGDACTTSDVCSAGSCGGTAVDCSGSDDMCNVGFCSAGSCMTMPRTDGTGCDDGDACTASDVCSSGSCAGAAIDCSGSDDACNVGVCSAGSCTTTPRMDGTACDTGNSCAWADACGGGTCAGTVTDCAPRGAFVPGTTNTTLRGGGGGGAFLQACPAGSVMVGVAGAVASGFYSGVLTQVATLCSTLDVSSGAVVLGAPVRVPATGGAGGVSGSGATTATCAAGEVVVGFSGRSGSFVNNVALRCAPLALTGDATSGFALSVGATTDGAAVGSGSGTAFGATDCAAGEVARGAAGRSGEVVDAFGLRCGPPQLDVVTTAPLVGNAGGGINRDDCPGGVPIGVTGTVASGFYSQAITRYTTQCGRIDVTADGSGGWTVAVVPTGSVPSTGTRAIWSSTSGGPMSAACPANQVVVGLTGRAVARGASTLTLSCAPIAVTGDAVVGWTVTPGMAANATPVGSGAGTAYPAYSCPDGTIASGFYVRSGEILDGIALRCAMAPINVVP